MLFGVLVTSSREEDRIGILGFNATRVLAACSALMFVVLLSHIDLRSSLAAKGIIYLEDFYFVLYLSILVVAVNSIIFTWGLPMRVVQYRDNLIPKLLFWPMVTSQLFALTLFAL